MAVCPFADRRPHPDVIKTCSELVHGVRTSFRSIRRAPSGSDSRPSRHSRRMPAVFIDTWVNRLTQFAKMHDREPCTSLTNFFAKNLSDLSDSGQTRVIRVAKSSRRGRSGE